MLQGYGDTVLRAEALEEKLAKARKHSAILQSKLDGAFAQYHNEVQDIVGAIRNQAFRISKIKEYLSLPKLLCEKPSSETQEPLNLFSSFRISLSAHTLRRLQNRQMSSE
jgi:hypothetical protein